MWIAPGVPSGTANGPTSNGRPIAKYGPTVWEGVVSKITSVRLLERRRARAAEVDVPLERLRPVRHRPVDREPGDHPLAGALVSHRVEDRVIREERVAREVHLGHEPLGERAAEQREVDMGRPPGVVVIAPRVRPGPDRRERVAALVVGDAPSGPGEVRIERRRPPIPPVHVSPGGVRLPDLDERPAQRVALGVEHAPRDDDPLSDRLALVLDREVVVVLADQHRAELRPGDLGDRLRQVDERLLGVAQGGRLVARIVERRVGALGLPQVARRRLADRVVDLALAARLGFKLFGHSNLYASSTTARPWPTPMQSAATPYPPPRRRSSWARPPRMRTPDAPSG